MVEYLNSASTQEALGVNLNYTSFLTPLMRDAFTETGKRLDGKKLAPGRAREARR